jgi:2-methylcitrate dehydratase PrpD
VGRDIGRVTSPPDLTAVLAEHTAGIDVEASEQADLERLRHCVLDWLGATVAGTASPAAHAVRSIVVDTRDEASATVVGTRLRCTPRDAALSNGVAAHALEVDDVARWMGGHPSASICAATLALAETRRAEGADVAAALLAGYDVACHLGVALGPGHSAAGWHATGTLGTFASAAACARLLRLDADATRRALGLAATQAAGLKASIGTMGKPLHAGKAAADGMLAALLAEQGCTAPALPVESFAAATTTTFDARRSPIEPGVRSIVFKRHACCGLAQASIDAILNLRAAHRFSAAEVHSVELAVAPNVLAVCRHARPNDEVEAKFSLPFAAAVALAARDTGPAGFGEESVRDPVLLALCARVTAVERDTADTHATIELADGRLLRTIQAPERPATDAELPGQWARLVAKFRALAVPRLGEESAAEIITEVRAPTLDGLLAAARASRADGRRASRIDDQVAGVVEPAAGELG